MYMRLVILWRSSKEANTDIKFIQAFVILMNFSITLATYFLIVRLTAINFFNRD